MAEASDDSIPDPFGLTNRDITDRRVLAAMARVPRDAFIPDAHRHEARGDHPLPIGCGQTISQPYIVAWMSQELGVEPGQSVLEVGTGCGYQTAILAELGATVYSLEMEPTLAETARRTLGSLGYDRLHLRVADGYDGWPEAAPFDRILLTAAPPDVPQTLLDQLADGGRLVGPVGTDWQAMVTIDRRADTWTRRSSIPVRFVPMRRAGS